MDLAVGIIIGADVTAIVTSVVEDLVKPLNGRVICAPRARGHPPEGDLLLTRGFGPAVPVRRRRVHVTKDGGRPARPDPYAPACRIVPTA